MHKYQSAFLFAIAVIISLFAGYFVFFPVADGDIFWHLAAGREIVQHKSLLFSDPFSYTTPGITWIDLHWLFQLISYNTYCLAGFYGMLWLKSAVIAITVFFLIHPLKTYHSAIVISIIVLFALFQCRYLVPLRPGIFTLLYLSLFIRCLEAFTVTFSFRYFIALVMIQVAWVNTQGLFMIGPAVFGAYFSGWLTHCIVRKYGLNSVNQISFRYSKLFIFGSGLLLLTAASLVNPYGLQGLLFPLKLLARITPGERNVFSNVIDENMPLISMIGTDYQYYVITFIILWIVLLVSTIFSRNKPKFAHIYVVIGFTLLAFMAQRNLILFVVAIIPLLKSNVEGISFFKLPRVSRFVLIITGCLLSCYIVFAVIMHHSMLRSVNGPVAPFCHPVKSVAYLESYDLKGRVFNADRYGGYLLWKTFPRYPVFIDTRLTMRERSFFVDYLALLEAPEKFDSVAKAYDITAVLIPASIPRYFKLVRYLSNNLEWSMVVADGSECLFVKEPKNPADKLDFQDTLSVKKYLSATRMDPMLKTDAIKNEAQTRFITFMNVPGIR